MWKEEESSLAAEFIGKPKCTTGGKKSEAINGVCNKVMNNR